MHMNKYLAMKMKERKCDDKGVWKIQWLLKENVWENTIERAAVSVGCVCCILWRKIFRIFPSWMGLRWKNPLFRRIKRHRFAFDDNYMFKWQFYRVCCAKCYKLLLLRFVAFLIFVHNTSHIGCAEYEQKQFSKQNDWQKSFPVRF